MDERVRRTVETYERVADDYADCHGGDRAAVADIVERFVDAVADATADGGSGPGGTPRVLDVGCGPGWESAAFAEAGFEAVPFDLTRRFLAQARERVPDATPVRGDMRALPFADGAFDGLWACASLLHVPESEVPETLADFERVLAPGGVVFASLKRAGDGDLELDGSPYERDERHFERYEPERVRELFEAAGFEVVALSTDDEDADTVDSWVAVTAKVPE